jgi:hypothetical protein
MTVAEDRERVLENYLNVHPKRGLPNPRIAEHWQDGEFAERVICSGERRLTRAHVAEIRESAGGGKSVEEITEIAGAPNIGQVARVIRGKTYRRIR